MKNFFCQQCAAKPGWEFDTNPSVVFQHACQRCFRNLPCNDYSHKLPNHQVTPAPRPKDLVAQNLNTQSEVNLPKAKAAEQKAVPVYEVAPPSEDTRNETDKLLDGLQPNRPGIKMTTTDKNGRPSAGKPSKV